ncbi:hypothetical protein SAMN03080610_01599 [Afifella marina DSM 2698]|uniref:Uncharacterized protein n=1 Tax=Afifella marina DSM 2698 TaxID=1120955 RepID=A0A1G5N6T8_AFIMA|nr:hypothetical protein SAMN03080610_01599 [Afifella marina DSM 2698]
MEFPGCRRITVVIGSPPSLDHRKPAGGGFSDGPENCPHGSTQRQTTPDRLQRCNSRVSQTRRHECRLSPGEKPTTRHHRRPSAATDLRPHSGWPHRSQATRRAPRPQGPYEETPQESCAPRRFDMDRGLASRGEKRPQASRSIRSPKTETRNTKNQKARQKRALYEDILMNRSCPFIPDPVHPDGPPIEAKPWKQRPSSLRPWPPCRPLPPGADHPGAHLR